MQHSLRVARVPLLIVSALAASACSETIPTAPGIGPDGRRALAEMAASEVWNGNIRIGVIPSAASVTIGSAGDFAIADAEGKALASGSDQSVSVRSVGVTVTHYWLQVTCAFSPAGIPPLVAIADAHDVPWMTEPHPTQACTRLLVGDRTGSDATTAARNDFEWNQMIPIGLAPRDSTGFWHSKTVGETFYRFAMDGKTIDSRTPVVLTSSTGLVSIGGRTYRGAATVVRNSTGSVAGVNELPIEDYLLGVVPNELPPDGFGAFLEAEKVQAIASRTYARFWLGKRAANGYDLLASTSDQVYGGYASEHPLTTQAVRETEGVVATYGGKIIETVYSSTSGGFGANNEEVYNSSPIPYLRGKPDAQRGVSLEHAPDKAVFKYARNASSLRGFKGGDYEADWSRYHRWTFEWTADEISQIISAYAGEPVGKVHAINVIERGPSGRALLIEYITDAGTFTDTKDHIRTSLKFINASGVPTSLLSTLFYIDPVTDKQTGEVTGFAAYGGGWGHGVGMCQVGAVGRAERGQTHEEILKHYYTGIELEKRW